MKNNFNKELENNEDVKKIKIQYRKLLKIVFIIFLLIFLLFIINFVKTYLEFSKILKANFAVDLGENYKVITNTDGFLTHICYKDGVKKTVRHEGLPNEIIAVQTKDKAYMFSEKNKIYWDIESDKMDISKVDLIYSTYWLKEDITAKNVIRVMLTEGVKIEKESFEGKDYIILKMNMIKIWINPDTYFAEKEIRYGEEIERIIEKDVVTDEDMNIPNMEGYEYQKIEGFKIR